MLATRIILALCLLTVITSAVTISDLETRLFSTIRLLNYKERTALDEERWLMSRLEPPSDRLDNVRLWTPSRRVLDAARRVARTASDYMGEMATELYALVGEPPTLDKKMLEEFVYVTYFNGDSVFPDVLNRHILDSDKQTIDQIYLWEFFHNPQWDRTEFPRSLDMVDMRNGYMRVCAQRVYLEELAERIDTWYHREWMGKIEPYPEQLMRPEMIRDHLFPRYPAWLSASWLDSLLAAENEGLPSFKKKHFLLRELLISNKAKHRRALHSIPHRLATWLIEEKNGGRSVSVDDVSEQLIPVWAADRVSHYALMISVAYGETPFTWRTTEEIDEQFLPITRAQFDLFFRISFACKWAKENDEFDEDDFEEDWDNEHIVFEEEQEEDIYYRLLAMAIKEWRLRGELAELDWKHEEKRLIMVERHERLKELRKLEKQPGAITYKNILKRFDDLLILLIVDQQQSSKAERERYNGKMRRARAALRQRNATRTVEREW